MDFPVSALAIADRMVRVLPGEWEIGYITSQDGNAYFDVRLPDGSEFLVTVEPNEEG